MWHLFNCYLTGRHDYGMWCKSGQIFLRCTRCGKRSPGWAVERKPAATASQAPAATAPARKRRVVGVNRAAAS